MQHIHHVRSDDHNDRSLWAWSARCVIIVLCSVSNADSLACFKLSIACTSTIVRTVLSNWYWILIACRIRFCMPVAIDFLTQSSNFINNVRTDDHKTSTCFHHMHYNDRRLWAWSPRCVIIVLCSVPTQRVLSLRLVYDNAFQACSDVMNATFHCSNIYKVRSDDHTTRCCFHLMHYTDRSWCFQKHKFKACRCFCDSGFSRPFQRHVTL